MCSSPSTFHLTPTPLQPYPHTLTLLPLTPTLLPLTPTPLPLPPYPYIPTPLSPHPYTLTLTPLHPYPCTVRVDNMSVEVGRERTPVQTLGSGERHLAKEDRDPAQASTQLRAGESL